MGKHYLVTGGAGFIGSHIVEALLKRGDQVRILDNFATSKREDFIKNVAQAFRPDGVKAEALSYVEASITDPKAIASAFKGIDGVFHTAALPRVQYSIEHPRESNEVNINGTLNVVLAAKEAGVKRIVYSASSSAYGDQPTLPLAEQMKPNPGSPYGLQKYVGEEYCKVASMCWGIETVSLRYFNVYGPRLAFEGAYVTVIAVFLQQRAAGQPLTITGDGTQTRDFTYIDDVVAANLLAMEGTKVGQGEVINIGAGNNLSVNAVAEYFKHPTQFIAPRLEPHDTLADIRRAKELLGWEPQTPFEEGIKITMGWFGSLSQK